MELALKEFFTSFHLGITLVLNLEPRRLLWLRDVRPKAMLRHDSFQVLLTDMLEQRRSVLGHMFDGGENTKSVSENGANTIVDEGKAKGVVWLAWTRAASV